MSDDGRDSPSAALAKQFHDIYERLAPSFGYVPRSDTQIFDPTSPSGQLMIAVCKEILGQNMLVERERKEDGQNGPRH